MGSTPAVYLEGLRSIFNIHNDSMDNLQMSDFLSNGALEMKFDSLLLDNDDSLWDMCNRLNKLVENEKPDYYFSPMALDTSSELFLAMTKAFNLDDCATGWHPRSPVVLYHSKRDNCIPFEHASMVYSVLADDNGNCRLYTPIVNGSHVQNSVLFYAKLLRLREDILFKKYADLKNISR